MIINTICYKPFVFLCDWLAFERDDFYLIAYFNRMNIAFQKPPDCNGRVAFPSLERDYTLAQVTAREHSLRSAQGCGSLIIS